MQENSKIQVLMVGEDPSLRGGISSVQNLILDYAQPEISIEHLATIKAYPTDPALPKLIVFAGAIIKLLVRLIQRDIDVIHIHFAERGSVLRKVILSALILLFRQPFILHAHGSEFHEFYLKSHSLVQKLIKVIFRRSNQFIVLSKSWKKFYIKELALPDDLVVIMNNPVVIPDQVSKYPVDSTIRILCLGRISERKGTFDLIKAFSALPIDLVESSHLLLAGDGDIDIAQNLTEELDIGKHIKFLGWVNKSERNQLLEQADIFVLPSYNEGLPMAILEAMSYAIPIITTPVGGIPEVITDKRNGLLIPPGNIKILTKNLQALLENQTYREALGNKARSSVQPYNVQAYCNRLTQIYKALSKSP